MEPTSTKKIVLTHKLQWIAGPMSIDDSSQIENYVTLDDCHFAMTRFERIMLISQEHEGYLYQNEKLILCNKGSKVQKTVVLGSWPITQKAVAPIPSNLVSKRSLSAVHACLIYEMDPTNSRAAAGICMY